MAKKRRGGRRVTTSTVETDTGIQRFIISPSGHCYRAWQNFLAILVIFSAWASPFEFGFLDEPTRVLATADFIIDAFFGIDIFLTFCVAYIDRKTYFLIKDPRQIGWKYISTWLIPDAGLIILPHLLPSYGVLLRLWRLRRLHLFFARLEKNLDFDYKCIRLVKVIGVTLFTCHFFASLFHYVIVGSSDPTDLWRDYMTYMYRSITTLTTVGYGDLRSQTPSGKEMALEACFMLVNLGVLSYVVGNMTSLFSHGTDRTRKYRDAINDAVSFAQKHRLPRSLEEQIISHFDLRFRTAYEGLQQLEIIEDLPRAIRNEISNYLFYPVISDVYLFRGVSCNMLSELVSKVRADYVPPKEDIILQHEASTDFYILVTGSLDLIDQTRGTREVCRVAKTGDLVGEIGVLCLRTQRFTARTKSLCQLLRLDRATFLSIIRSNVGDGTIIMNNLLQHMNEHKDHPAMKGVLREIEEMLAQGRTDLPLTLRFAVTRYDHQLLHQLLRHDSDPNESDDNGCTVLHVAASKGKVQCVRLLLCYGADPNRRDSRGSVPLWEAMLEKHEEVCGLLIEQGADLSLGDVDSFIKIATEQDRMELLQTIVLCGGDVSTALHPESVKALFEAMKFSSAIRHDEIKALSEDC